jgi:inosose dehydratase
MRFGYQTVRWGWGHVADRVPAVLDELSAAGFEAAEVNEPDVVPYLQDPQAFAAMFSEHSVQFAGLVYLSLRPLVLSRWDPYRAYAWRQINKYIDFAGEAGCEVFVLGGLLTASARKGVTDKEYRRVADMFTQLGARCKKLGMKASYHPMIGSIGCTVKQLQRVLGDTDPDLLNLTLDTGHLAAGGLDPEEVLRAFASRVDHVHLKDVKAGVFVELGEGTDYDVPGVMRALRSLAYRGWVIVEDEVLDSSPALSLIGRTDRTPLETARNSLRYVSQYSRNGEE